MRSPATGLTDHERGTCFRATVRMFTAAELRDWMLTAGFREARAYGDDGELLTLEHRRMTVVGRK